MQCTTKTSDWNIVLRQQTSVVWRLSVSQSPNVEEVSHHVPFDVSTTKLVATRG